jgi:co-chaperonin GroES (HSP10)
MIPTGNRVFIRPIIEEMSGRFHLVKMSREMPDKGFITAISPKAKEELGLDVGDCVAFNKNYQQLSEDYNSTMVSSEHILAKIE